MMLALSYASAKETADRIAGRNRKCQKEWRYLFAEVAFCEVMRNQFTTLQGVESDELREQAKSKNSFVAFMQNENKEFVSYYIYREYTVLFDKMKERRPDDFANLDESDPEAMVKGIVKILTRLGFNGVSETNKLLRTPEEEAEAEATAVAKREGNAVAKRVKMELASKQLAKINGTDKDAHAVNDVELTSQHALVEEAASGQLQHKEEPREEKDDASGDGEDLIAKLVAEAESKKDTPSSDAKDAPSREADKKAPEMRIVLNDYEAYSASIYSNKDDKQISVKRDELVELIEDRWDGWAKVRRGTETGFVLEQHLGMAPKPASTSNRGRPKKPVKKNVVIESKPSGDSLIAHIMSQQLDTSSEASSDDDNDGGVEETKSDDTPKRKRGRPSTRKELVSGDVDDPKESAQVCEEDELTTLRARVKQLEEFITGNGLEVPLPMPLMDAKEAEDIVASEGFKELEDDPVLSEDDGVNVKPFTHDGVKYYKDTDNNLYAFDCDMDEAEIIGTWNEETECVEEVEVESDSEEESDDE